MALVAAVAILSAQASSAQRISVIQPTGKWVVDQADMLTDQEERRLSERTKTYAEESSTQIVIVTIPSLGGYPIADYAVELGRSWEVGQAGYDNGIVVLVSRDDRKVFIATGYGVEGAVPDAVAGRIVRNVITPNFRAGRFYEGLAGATDRLIEATRGEFQAEPQQARGGGDGDSAVALVVILLVLVFLVFLVVVISMRRDQRHGDHRPPDRRPRRRRRRRRSYFPRSPGVIIWGGGGSRRGGSSGGGWSRGGGGFSGGSFGGFSGGGGSFGGGGAGGSW